MQTNTIAFLYRIDAPEQRLADQPLFLNLSALPYRIVDFFHPRHQSIFDCLETVAQVGWF